MNNDIKFLDTEWRRTRHSLTNFEDHFELHALFLDPNVCGFWYLYVDFLQNSSGQLAKLVVYIIPLEQVCIAVTSYCQNGTNSLIFFHHKPMSPDVHW